MVGWKGRNSFPYCYQKKKKKKEEEVGKRRPERHYLVRTKRKKEASKKKKKKKKKKKVSFERRVVGAGSKRIGGERMPGLGEERVINPYWS